MLSSVSLRCGRRVVTHNNTGRSSKPQNPQPTLSRSFTTDKVDDTNPPEAQPKDSLETVNKIFSKLKSSYKSDPFNTAQTVPGSTREPVRSNNASWRPPRYVSGSKSDARKFANNFTDQVASNNAKQPIADVVPEFQKILTLNRDRLYVDIVSTWRALVAARPTILAPPKILQIVILSFMRTFPDWNSMVKLFDDHLKQQPLTDKLASLGIRTYGIATRWNDVISIWNAIESKTLNPEFSKPHLQSLMYRNVIDAYGGLERLEDVQRVLEVSINNLPKDNLPVVFVGAMNAFVDANKPEEALKIFNRGVSDLKIPVPQQLSAALRRAKHPIARELQERSDRDADIFSRFLMESLDPQKALNGAWDAYEGCVAENKPLSITAYVILMNVLLKNAIHPQSGERAQKIFKEAQQSGEFDLDPVNLSSVYMEIMLTRGDVAEFDRVYRAAIRAPACQVRRITFEFIMDYFLKTQKDAARALSVWHDATHKMTLFSYEMCASAFSIYDELKMKDEAVELFHILKTGERGITQARLAYDRVIPLVIKLATNTDEVKNLAEEAVWAETRGLLLPGSKPLSTARTYLKEHGIVELRSDKLIAAHNVAVQQKKPSSEPVILFDDPVHDYVSPDLVDPEATKRKYIPYQY